MHKGTEVVKYIRAIYILLHISKYEVLDITRWTDCLSAACSCPVTVTDPVKGTRASKTSFGVVAEVPKAAIVAVEILAFVDI